MQRVWLSGAGGFVERRFGEKEEEKTQRRLKSTAGSGAGWAWIGGGGLESDKSGISQV